MVISRLTAKKTRAGDQEVEWRRQVSPWLVSASYHIDNSFSVSHAYYSSINKNHIVIGDLAFLSILWPAENNHKENKSLLTHELWTWGSGRTENGEQSRITGLDCSIWQLLASHTGNVNQVPQNLACEEETLTCLPAVRNSHFTKLDENIGAPQPFTSSSASWSSKRFTPEMWKPGAVF